MLLIIAGTHNQFKDWMQLNRMPRKKAIYVYSPECLRGLMRGTTYVLVGTYYDRKDISEIKVIIQTKDCINVSDNYNDL